MRSAPAVPAATRVAHAAMAAMVEVASEDRREEQLGAAAAAAVQVVVVALGEVVLAAPWAEDMLGPAATAVLETDLAARARATPSTSSSTRAASASSSSHAEMATSIPLAPTMWAASLRWDKAAAAPLAPVHALLETLDAALKKLGPGYQEEAVEAVLDDLEARCERVEHDGRTSIIQVHPHVYDKTSYKQGCLGCFEFRIGLRPRMKILSGGMGNQHLGFRFSKKCIVCMQIQNR